MKVINSLFLFANLSASVSDMLVKYFLITVKPTFFGFFFLRVVKNKVDGVIRLQDHTSTGNVHSG